MCMFFMSGEEGVVMWCVGKLEWMMWVDDYGYWELILNIVLVLEFGWYEIELVFVVSGVVGLLVFDLWNMFGIILDIDDMIFVSEVLSMWWLFSNSLMIFVENCSVVLGFVVFYYWIVKKNLVLEVMLIFYVFGLLC